MCTLPTLPPTSRFPFSGSENDAKTFVQQIHETLETYSLNEMLDDNLSKAKDDTDGFIIVSAIYGVLKNSKRCKDVTQICQDVVKQQGGRSLFLKEGPKKTLFGNPAEGKRKQLNIVFTVGGDIKRMTFEDEDAVILPQ